MEKFMSLHGKVYVPSWKSLCPFMEKFMSLKPQNPHST